MTRAVPAWSWVVRSRLKSMIVWGSTWYLLARLSIVSVDLVVTTIPCTGGTTIWLPVATESVDMRLVLDQRISATLTWNLVAIAVRSSPAATVYMNGWRLTGAEVGIDTGLITVLYRPSETSPYWPPSPTTTASAFTGPNLAVRVVGKWRSIAA